MDRVLRWLPGVPEEALWFSGLVVGLLVVASLAGLAMRRMGRGGPGLDNYSARVNAWWVMCAVMLACMAAGPAVSTILFAIASFMALREFVALTPTKPSDYWGLFLAFYVAVPVQYWLVATGWYGLFSIFIPVWLFALVSAAGALSQDTDDFLARNAKIQFAILTCVYGVSHAPALAMLEIGGFHGKGVLLLFFLVFVSQLSDVLQYVSGKLFGKRLLIPRVSPSKTVEGLVGGGLAASLAAAGMWWMTPFTPWQCFWLGVLIVAGGFLGGLVMSAVKRSMGAKDWGSSIAGHGGFMDRLDSVAFAAPLFFHTVRYFWT